MKKYKKYKVEVRFPFCEGLTIIEHIKIKADAKLTKKAMFECVKMKYLKRAKTATGFASPKDIKVKILKEW